ncbi:Ig-like domain-containing protein [Rapidithrix thailandica]|uniref:Ig-like domain-containing protein n=1 Tax=Rapidithrix thailandica TaxID=413964 RepID=A0AAW9SHB7_9BACT
MLKKTFTGLLLLSGLWAGSCKDSDEEVQIDVKNIQVTGLEEGAEVWNTAELSVTTENQEGIQQIDFYIGDESIASDKTAPYEFTWNTREYEDGEYTVKMVVVTTGGKTVEKSLTVQVKNTLLTLDINQAYLDDLANSDFDTRYMVLSDTLGNVLHTVQIKQAGTIPLLAPEGFTEGRFDLTEFSLKENLELDEFHVMYSFLSLSRGTLWNLHEKQAETTSIRLLKPDNPGQLDSYVLSTNEGSEYNRMDWGPDNLVIPQSSNRLFVKVETEAQSTFKILENIKSGEHYEVDLTGFSEWERMQDVQKEIPGLVKPHSLGGDIKGFFGDDQDGTGFYVSYIESDDSHFNYTHAGSTFERYQHSIKFKNQEGVIFYNDNYPGQSPVFERMEEDQVEIIPHNVYDYTFNVKGDCDYFRSYVHDSDFNLLYLMFGPKDRKQFHELKTLPEEIKSKLPGKSEVGYFDVAVFDYEKIDSYEEFIKIYAEEGWEKLEQMESTGMEIKIIE